MLNHIQPIIDTLTLSVRYNARFAGMRDKDEYIAKLDKVFDSLWQVIWQDTGRKVQYARKEDTYYVPGYGISFTQPDAKFGYGKVYFQPTWERLELIQRWLNECFGPAYVNHVHLTNIELAYDFYCESLSFSDYEALVPRIAAHIVQKNGINQFVVALQGKRKRCGDGATNGETTCYVQSCDKHGASNLSKELDYRRRVAGHSNIYAKSIHDRAFLRIEMKLDKGKAKRCGIVFDPRNMSELVNLPALPFTKFWKFQTVDVGKFIDALYPLQGLRNIRHKLWADRLQKVVNAPVADQIRFMKIACRGNKKLKGIMKKCVKDMRFDDVVNTRLPDNFSVAWRKGAGLPDDGELPEKIELLPFEHDPLPCLPVKPVQVELPIKPERGQNRAKLASTAAQFENPVKPIAQPIKAPREAQEVEMRRTRWPDKPKEDDDGIFRLVELPEGMRITQAQICQNPTYSAVSGT